MNMSLSERDIAMVFKIMPSAPHMSVYDNMAYGLRNRKVPKAEIIARSIALLIYARNKPFTG